MKPDSHRLFVIDAAVIVIVSIAICLWADRLALMTVLVPAVILARHIALASIAKTEGINIKAEIAFWLICTLLGAFNDWNSVVHHKIYDYTVPHYFSFTSIPIWMLLFWGMILRFFARLARWQPLSPPPEPSNRLGIGKFRINNAIVKVAAELLLVMLTRQTIYRFYLEPVLSWLPFLFALLIFVIFFAPTRHDFLLMAVFLIGGPLIEILYIQVGHLHRYHLGWIAGVPLWIALWWLLIIVIWKDLALRIETVLSRRL